MKHDHAKKIVNIIVIVTNLLSLQQKLIFADSSYFKCISKARGGGLRGERERDEIKIKTIEFHIKLTKRKAWYAGGGDWKTVMLFSIKS